MTTYHVSIEFNNSGKRDVGTVIYLLERRKFVFKNREDKVLEPDGLRTYTIELEGHCRKPAFLDHLKCRYSKQKLEKKLQHFIHNHVDLTFESTRENVGLEELRAYITIGAFPQKNPPIVCVYKEDV
ncbi:hypothetical protein IJU97_02995 [bacterium]|nr:hypothetical protein [bacterium]